MFILCYAHSGKHWEGVHSLAAQVAQDCVRCIVIDAEDD